MKLRWMLLGLLLVALLVPSLMLTAARVLQPDEGRWVRLVAFTPYAIPLYALALVLLLLAMAGRGARRRVSGFVALLVVLLLALHAFWASGPYVGQVPAAEGPRFRVMTANLSFGEADPARVVDLAVKNDIDALVLSEITPAVLSRMNAAGLSRAFPNAAGEAASGVRGTMVFTTQETSKVVPLETKFGSYAVTVPVGSGRTLQLVAVHANPPVDDAAEWRADHRVIQDFVAQNEAAGDATLIAGDFNATPDHQVLGELDDLGFRSAADATNSQWQPTWPAAGEMSFLGIGVPSMLQIDHVLVTGDAEPVNTETATIQGTDHRALVATVALQ